MKDTCVDTCSLYKKRKNCPNYVASGWIPKDEKEPVIIQDCAVTRTFYMMRNLENQMLTLQKEMETLRNAYVALLQVMREKHVLLKGP